MYNLCHHKLNDNNDYDIKYSMDSSKLIKSPLFLKHRARGIYIGDTINKGNESHVGNIQFWFLNINPLSIKNATL